MKKIELCAFGASVIGNPETKECLTIDNCENMGKFANLETRECVSSCPAGSSVFQMSDSGEVCCPDTCAGLGCFRSGQVPFGCCHPDCNGSCYGSDATECCAPECPYCFGPSRNECLACRYPDQVTNETSCCEASCLDDCSKSRSECNSCDFTKKAEIGGGVCTPECKELGEIKCDICHENCLECDYETFYCISCDQTSSQKFLNTLTHTCVQVCPVNTYISLENHCIELTKNQVCERIYAYFPENLNVCAKESSFEFQMEEFEFMMSVDTFFAFGVVQYEEKKITLIKETNASDFLESQMIKFNYEVENLGKKTASVIVQHSSGISCISIHKVEVIADQRINIESTQNSTIVTNITRKINLQMLLTLVTCETKEAPLTEEEIALAEMEWKHIPGEVSPDKKMEQNESDASVSDGDSVVFNEKSQNLTISGYTLWPGTHEIFFKITLLGLKSSFKFTITIEAEPLVAALDFELMIVSGKLALKLDSSASHDPNSPLSNDFDIEWISKPPLLFNPSSQRVYVFEQEDVQFGEIYTVTIWVHKFPMESQSAICVFQPNYNQNTGFTFTLFFEGGSINNGDSASVYSSLKAEDYHYVKLIWDVHLPGDEENKLSSEETTLVSYPVHTAPFNLTSEVKEIIVKLRAFVNEYYAEAEIKIGINHPPLDVELSVPAGCQTFESLPAQIKVIGESDFPAKFRIFLVEENEPGLLLTHGEMPGETGEAELFLSEPKSILWVEVSDSKSAEFNKTFEINCLENQSVSIDSLISFLESPETLGDVSKALYFYVLIAQNNPEGSLDQNLLEKIINEADSEVLLNAAFGALKILLDFSYQNGKYETQIDMESAASAINASLSSNYGDSTLILPTFLNNQQLITVNFIKEKLSSIGSLSFETLEKSLVLLDDIFSMGNGKFDSNYAEVLPTIGSQLADLVVENSEPLVLESEAMTIQAVNINPEGIFVEDIVINASTKTNSRVSISNSIIKALPEGLNLKVASFEFSHEADFADLFGLPSNLTIGVNVFGFDPFENQQVDYPVFVNTTWVNSHVNFDENLTIGCSSREDMNTRFSNSSGCLFNSYEDFSACSCNHTTEYALKFTGKVEESLTKTQVAYFGDVNNLDDFEYYKSIAVYYLAFLSFFAIIGSIGAYHRDIYELVTANTMVANFRTIYIRPDGIATSNNLSPEQRKILEKTQNCCYVFEISLLVHILHPF